MYTIGWMTAKDAARNQSSNLIRDQFDHEQPVQHIAHVGIGEFDKSPCSAGSDVIAPILQGEANEDREAAVNSG